MLPFDPKLLHSFTVLDVYDPDELGNDSSVSRRFPGYNNSNTYRLLNRGVRNERPAELLSRLAVRREGELTIGYIEARYGTEVGIVGHGFQRLFLTFSLSGSIALPDGTNDPAAAAGTQGLVYRGRPGTRLLTSDDSTRITVQIEEARLLRVWASLLGNQTATLPAFAAEVDWASPAMAPLTRAIRYLIGELGDPAGLLSIEAARETFTDTLAQLMLTRLPHSQSERLRAARSPAIPQQLRRAEEFIEAHAAQPITLSDIAAAAGCSARALQMAFRRFRDTTPLGALQEARLQAVRAALAATDAPAANVARTFGFSNATRFRAAYRRRFGTPPEPY